MLIGEVVDVVARKAVHTVVHGSLMGSLAGSGEVRFQGRSAGVEIAHHICVVSPALTEHFFKSAGKLLEWGDLS